MVLVRVLASVMIILPLVFAFRVTLDFSLGTLLRIFSNKG
jgi:hypothetical protein